MYTHLNDMNKYRQSIRFLVFMAILAVLFIPELALAKVPELVPGNVGIPGVDKDTPIVKTLGLTVGFVGFIFVLFILVFGLGDTMASFFRQLNDSRKEGDWSPLIKFIAITFVVLVIIFLIMGYIAKYAFDPINSL